MLLGEDIVVPGHGSISTSTLAQGITLYDLQAAPLSGVPLWGGCWGGVSRLCCLGAVVPWVILTRDWHGTTSVILAQQIRHPFSLGYALSCAAYSCITPRGARSSGSSEAVILLATEQGFPFGMAIGSSLCGWVLHSRAKFRKDRTGYSRLTAFKPQVQITRSYYLALLAEAHGTMGQPEVGLTVLTEALTLVTQQENGGTSQSCIGSRQTPLQQGLDIRLKPSAASITPWR